MQVGDTLVFERSGQNALLSTERTAPLTASSPTPFAPPVTTLFEITCNPRARTARTVSTKPDQLQSVARP